MHITHKNAEMNRVHRTAELPEAALQPRGLHSGGGSSGRQSGKGGHNPRTEGEKKGLGSHRTDGLDPWKPDSFRM